MKKPCKIFIIVYSLLFTVYCIHAQNLVPNPSFETYTACPTGSGQIYVASPWTGPTYNSTDYLNVCSSSAGVPSITTGYYQWPRTGNGNASFWAGFNNIDYREYLQAPLIKPLTAGKCYYIEFYTNLANYVDVAVNNIAAHLSDTSYGTNATYGNLLSLIPHALKFGNPVITDTLNWVKVSGVYVAAGGENYIIIGNFKDDAHTDSIGIQPGINRAGYYYIDDVSVIPIDSISMPPYAGNDTTIAFGDSVFIGQQLYGLHCNWYSNSVLLNTNISGIWVKPNITTTYVVEQNLCGNMGYDTVIVNVSPLGIDEFKDGGLKIYPNPANNKLFIEQTVNEKIIEMSLYDIYGKKIIKQNEQGQLDVSNLTEGVYFLKVKTKENIYAQKIIIEH